MNLKEFVLQDFFERDPSISLWRILIRCMYIPSYKVIINYRICQYIQKIMGGACCVYANWQCGASLTDT